MTETSKAEVAVESTTKTKTKTRTNGAFASIVAVDPTGQPRHALTALVTAAMLLGLAPVLRSQGATIGQLAVLAGFGCLEVLILSVDRAKNVFTLTFATAVFPAATCVFAAHVAGPFRDVFTPLIMAAACFAPQQPRWWAVAVGWLTCSAAWWVLLQHQGASGLIETALLSSTYAVIASLLYDKSARMRRLQHELRTETETAHAATRAKSQFLMAMSHEVRTPLNGVIGMSELALAGPLTVELRDIFTTIRSSADWLAMTFTEVLECARAENGRITFQDAEWEIRASMEETARLLAPAAHQKGLEIVLDIDPAVPLSARGDVFRIRQVVTRLASNGIKYSEEGFVRIHLSTPSEGRLAFVVEDTGGGIAEEDRERIVDGFPRIDGSTSRRFSGAGLELALAHELALRMGGTLQVHAPLGQGCTFLFEVPARTERTAPRSLPLAPMRCAVVSDLPASRCAIERLLVSLGATLGTTPGTTPCDSTLAPLVVFDVPVRSSASWLESQKPVEGRTVALLAPGTQATLALERLGISNVVFKPAFTSLGKALVAALEAPATTRGRPPRRGPNGSDGALVVLPLSTKPSPAPCRFTTLVADDNPVNAKVLVRLLQHLGADCETVANGALAVQRAREVRFDIIFMDINMPVMDGLEATRRIREDGRGEHIVAVTARSSSDDEGECQRAGMNGYLPKPVNARHLRALVKQIVQELVPTLEVANR